MLCSFVQTDRSVCVENDEREVVREVRGLLTLSLHTPGQSRREVGVIVGLSGS